MEAELKALEHALGNPERPVAAVVGGAKGRPSSPCSAICEQGRASDHRRGMANTFLAARGVNVGKSLCEHELTGKRTRFRARRGRRLTIHLPYDVVVAKEFAPNPPSVRTCNVHEVATTR